MSQPTSDILEKKLMIKCMLC